MSKKIYSAPQLNLNNSMLDIDALETIQELQKHRHDAYVVGGGVRDLLLGAKPKDFDIVTSATPEQVRKIFGRNSMIIGRRFKIVHVYFQKHNKDRSQKIGRNIYERHILEVSTFRSNKVHEDDLSSHGRILVDNNYGTMDEDAFRRDFTINALYYDPIAETIYDYHHGIEDIKSKTMRIIGRPQERYIEDPVRILRAIRLSEKLGLHIDDNTRIPFRNTRQLLQNEPRGRLFEEMIKILMSGHSAGVIKELAELKLPRKVFPLLDQLFFSNTNEMALRVLERTDARLAGGEDVSLTFVFASLIWQAINITWLEYQEQLSLSKKQALIEAIVHNKIILFNSGLTQNMYSAMRDVWMMQIDFDHPTLNKLDGFINNSRFRQAWHLYTLRNEFGQADAAMFSWWDKFMSSTDDDKTELLIELVDIAPLEPEKKRKKRRKNKNKKKHHKEHKAESI